jgi:hypothetical protein
MLIYKNRASGKNFIFLDDSGNNEGLFVTPPIHNDEVIIHSLSYDLFFEDPIELEENDDRIKEMLSNKQIVRFKTYKEKDRTRSIHNFIRGVIDTRNIDIEFFRKEYGDNCANLIKKIRENTKNLTVDDIE